MATDHSNISVQSFSVNGGDGPNSYFRNSFGQKSALDVAKGKISEAIVEKLDKEHFSSSASKFCIADLGCAAGPNTFFSVQNIIDSVLQKSQSLGFGSENLEFQVFFNDQASNDFNTLFKSLPSNRQYYAVGVPGSFHGRLFPKASLHFVHSSNTLHWLSEVPKELIDENSPAYNKGKVCYTCASREVEEAYKAQFAKDFESFLNARAIEVVPGGLMALVTADVPSDTKCSLTAQFDLFETALLDLVSMGLIREDKVDSFNIPMYFPTEQMLQYLIERNGFFNIERKRSMHFQVPAGMDVDAMVMHIRVGFEGLVRDHFGSEIIETTFDQFKRKMVESSILSDKSYKPPCTLFFVLKRK